jgi:hypothetical protein
LDEKRVIFGGRADLMRFAWKAAVHGEIPRDVGGVTMAAAIVTCTTRNRRDSAEVNVYF